MQVQITDLVETIEINPTELCNLRCSFCPRSTFYPNRNLHISIEHVKLIKNHLQEINYQNIVSFTGRGEPTLTENFEEIIDILTEDKTWVLKMHTNGKNLDKYSHLIPKFDILYYEVYGSDPKRFDNFEKELEKYGDMKNVKIVQRPDIPWEDKPSAYTNRAGSFETPLHFKEDAGFCERPITKLFIDWNGDYKLCCEDWKHHITLGNINNESIKEYVTNNPTLKRFRNNLLQGKRDEIPCNECTYKTRCNDRWINDARSYFNEN